MSLPAGSITVNVVFLLFITGKIEGGVFKKLLGPAKLCHTVKYWGKKWEN